MKKIWLIGLILTTSFFVSSILFVQLKTSHHFTSTESNFSKRPKGLNYEIADIEEVYNNFGGKFPPKNEFETTQEFKKRIQSTKVYTKVYGFKLPKEAFSLNYDADTQLLRVYTWMPSCYVECKKLNVYLEIKYLKVKEEGTKYVIVPVNDLSLEKKRNLSPEKARILLQNKSDFEAWVICKPCIANSLITGSSSSEKENYLFLPTFVSHSFANLTEELRCLNVDVLQIFLYNPQTNKKILFYP